MNEYNENNIEPQNEYEENLINTYSNMIKEHKNYLNNQIIKSISKITNKVESNQIERLIDKYLSLELEYTGIYTINNLTEDLDKKTKNICKQLENNQTNEKTLFEQYIEEMKKILKRNQMDWVSNITEDFVKVFIDELKKSLEYDSHLNQTEISSISNEITPSLKDIFNEYEDKFHNDYQDILKEYIENKLNQIKNLFRQIKNDIEQKNQIKKYYHIIEISNYELIEEENHIYIKDKETKEQYELFYLDKRLKTKDNEIIFNISEIDNHQGYINNIENKRIVIHDGFITLVLLNNKQNNENNEVQQKEIISFTKRNHHYKFYYNSKKTDDINEIEELLKKIKDNAKEMYRKMVNDKDFIHVKQLIDKKNREKLIDDLFNSIINENPDLDEKSSQDINPKR